MKMNEYLSQVTDQIRCQKVHKAVRAELQAHLEDQAEAYESEGMSADEAMEKAVLEMGDPVETGVSLDRVHRPHMEWSTLLLVGVIGIFSVILYMFAPFDYNEDIQNMSWYGMRQLVFTVAGYAVMLLVCRLDYSILDRFGTLAAGIVVALMLLATQFGLTVNGATYCLYLGCMFHCSGLYFIITVGRDMDVSGNCCCGYCFLRMRDLSMQDLFSPCLCVWECWC